MSDPFHQEYISLCMPHFLPLIAIQRGFIVKVGTRRFFLLISVVMAIVVVVIVVVVIVAIVLVHHIDVTFFIGVAVVHCNDGNR